MTTLRKSKRINSNIPGFFYVYGKKWYANIKDFSDSGIFLNCLLILKKNTLLTLHFFSQSNQLHRVQYQVVRSQSGINLRSSKPYHRGMGLELIGHQNPFHIFQPFSEQSSKPLKHEALNKPVHIIVFKHVYNFINLYHAQLSKLNLTFLSEKPAQTNTIIDLVIRSDDISFSIEFEIKVVKCIKDHQITQHYIYSEISNETLKALRKTVDQLLRQDKLYTNITIPRQGTVLQQPLAKLILKSIENKFSGQLLLKNFKQQPLAFCYFKEGQLLHIQSNDMQRFFKMILNHPEVPQRSKNKISHEPIQIEHAIELRDLLIRKNIIDANLMYEIWTSYTLKNFRLLGNMFNLEFEFIKKLPKEMIALNQNIDLKSQILQLLNGFDAIFLNHYTQQLQQQMFLIHKQKLYLWPEKYLSKHYKINENVVYTQKKLTQLLESSDKEILAFICYLYFINEIILV